MVETNSAWQKHDRKMITAFMQKNDWKHIYWIWKKRLSDFATPINPLFHEAAIHDPGDPQRCGLEFAWWPRNELDKRQHDSQKHFNLRPGTYGPTHPFAYQGNKGELHTLELLWGYREAPEQLSAVLISASIFSRLSSRTAYPEKWPAFVCVEALTHLVNDQWRSESDYWHHANTTVLPYTSSDSVYQLGDLRSFITFLADEHAALLHQFAPVAVRFTSENNVLSGG
jgi:hypothetical protein